MKEKYNNNSNIMPHNNIKIRNEVQKLDKTLKEIKEAEEKAEKIIEEGHRKAESILTKGKEDSTNFVKLKKENMCKERDKQFSIKKKEILDQKSMIMKKTDVIIKDLEKKTEKNQEAAIQTIIKEFKKIN
jgi:V/A-type H+/Na+-transporting ATPase subunit G/H